ncbi:MAG: hypothetical protein FJ297_05930 [Planctomycetes bacterium]|nr:hypothetical protein [Planctomycetota bacterium]
MKRVTITLHGTLTYSAHRTLEIEVSDDADLATIAPETLNELADFEQIPWVCGEFGYLDVKEYSVDSSTVITTDDWSPE